ncbi:fluoride efflux transporter FluC [Demequina sp.]|uniref:fluoride efflux transporter FluC n=1 Tax=Demequina sp. TaxID=2050685 RepID=UPI003D1151D0
MSAWVYVAGIVACGVGAAARYALGLARREGSFPWPTVAANVVGSAVLGAAAGAVATGAPEWVLVVGGAGLAGGLSTFSSLALDAVTLWGTARRWGAVAYLGATFALGIGAAWLGWLVTS